VLRERGVTDRRAQRLSGRFRILHYFAPAAVAIVGKTAIIIAIIIIVTVFR